MYEYICMSIYAWVYMYKNICISVYVWIIIDLWKYVYEYIWLSYSVWVYMYEYVCMYVWVNMYVWVCMYEYIYKYVHISMYQFIFTCMWCCVITELLITVAVAITMNRVAGLLSCLLLLMAMVPLLHTWWSKEPTRILRTM